MASTNRQPVPVLTSKIDNAALRDAVSSYMEDFEVISKAAEKENEDLDAAITNGLANMGKEDAQAKSELSIKATTAAKLKMIFPAKFTTDHLGGYQFKDQGLLLRALLHRKYKQKERPNSKLYCDPLDYIGDWVLKYIISRYILIHSRDKSKESLSKRRAMVERQEVYAFLAVKNNFHEYLFLDDGKEWEPLQEYIKSVEKLESSQELANVEKKKSFIHNFFQAVAGAIYVDNEYSFEKVEEVFLPLLQKELDAAILAPIQEDM